MVERMNRHIGRPMEYPYEGAAPRRQVAMVLDINKCIACQTCSVACKGAWTSGRGQETIFYNNVETKPYGGYPQGWDHKLMDILGPAEWKKGVMTSKTIFEGGDPLSVVTGHRPDVTDYSSPNLGEDEIAGSCDRGAHFDGLHPMWMFYLARLCNHCDSPACLASCPRKAIYKREEDGIVLVDQERCRGYQECVKACPYKKTFFNMVSRVSEKCIGCFPRVEQGQVPLCVEGCIGKIRLHGFLTTEGKPQEDNPLDYIIKIRKFALPLYPQFGTGPNNYYIPPITVHDSFLTQLFGPGVEASRKMYRNLKNDKKLLGALMLFGATDRIIEKFAVEKDVAIGWNGKGEEVARVPFTEPMYLRGFHDERFAVYRHNTP